MKLLEKPTGPVCRSKEKNSFYFKINNIKVKKHLISSEVIK